MVCNFGKPWVSKNGTLPGLRPLQIGIGSHNRPFLDLFTLRTKITAKSPLRPRNRLENSVIWTGEKESNLKNTRTGEEGIWILSFVQKSQASQISILSITYFSSLVVVIGTLLLCCYSSSVVWFFVPSCLRFAIPVLPFLASCSFCLPFLCSFSFFRFAILLTNTHTYAQLHSSFNNNNNNNYF